VLEHVDPFELLLGVPYEGAKGVDLRLEGVQLGAPGQLIVQLPLHI
jgi:hypothetical protein